MIKYCKKYTLVLILSLFLVACADDDHFDPHLKNSQNPKAYLNSKTERMPVLSPSEQAKAYEAFLKHYYSPWFDKSSIFRDPAFKKYMERSVSDLTYKRGYDENRHHHSRKWLSDIVEDINLPNFPNHLQNAIITRPTFQRALPTIKPSFTSNDKPGFTFPFDDFQGSFLPANTPVKILQVSKNHAWYFVQSNGSSGWVIANTVAVVDEKFIKNWQENKGYIEFKNDHIPVIDREHLFRFMSHMGAIYPIQSETPENYIIAIAVKDPNGKAIISRAEVSKKNADKIPLLASPENVAKIAERFIGMPYGWGDIYGYRDCSATTKDLFSYFGIWLPRDSERQSELGGKKTVVEKLENLQKLKMLEAQGIPFFTLVHLDGHIMLYLGKKDGKFYVLHDMWGLKTKHWFREEGRAVVGKTVITPIDFGKDYINVKASLLDRMLDFTVLTQPNGKG